MSELKYQSFDRHVDAFLELAQRVWPRTYDRESVSEAIGRTINIGVWDGNRLIGAVRVLTDGHLFATIPEILVDPEYQRRGIGRELMYRAVAAAPTGKIFFGAQPEAVGFFERIGCVRGPIGFVVSMSVLAAPQQGNEP